MTISPHRQEIKRRHALVLKAYGELSRKGLPKMIMWGELEKRTRYTRVGLQKILKQNGINY